MDRPVALGVVSVRNPERPVKNALLPAPAMDVEVLVRKRLRSLIREKYGSLDRFYLETDFSKGHLSDILRGRNSPSLRTLKRLAKALDVDVFDLLDRSQG